MMEILPPQMTVPQEIPADPQAQAIGEFPYQDDSQMQEPKPEVDVISSLNAKLEMTNIADGMDKDELKKIGQKVVDDFNVDKESRAKWESDQEEIYKLVEMAVEKKFWAGKLVSNVKYPLILNAAIHFASRAYPEIVKGKDVCKCAVIGKDTPDGVKAAQAKRVGQHLSYQLIEEMDWEAELDQLLMTYCITGSEFKKTYYCPLNEKNVSELVHARDLVINYWCKDIENATRITHVVELSRNDIVERINSGVFCSDIEIDKLGQPEAVNKDGDTVNDDDAPYEFLEQHRWLDLDDDGYKEPYIVTVHKDSATVCRICVRFDASGIKKNDQGKLKKIEPVQYFTHYKFMPSIDGGFYGIGFGRMLYGINSSVNTMLNQLIDAGTSNNRMSGFIGRGVQIGRTSASADGFSLGYGEWKSVPSTGDDLRKNIIPMPSKEPSLVLFQLAQFLIEAGKEMSSVSDIMSGESPGPNVPAASTLALIEQGMKVFSGIFKRLYRGLKCEFQKVARLNRLYLDEEKYMEILDDPQAVLRSDYSDKTLNIIPVADPNNLSDTGKTVKVQALMGLVGQGLNDMEIKRRYIENLNIENPDTIMPKEEPGPPPISPEVQAEIEKTNAEKEKIKSETVESRIKAIFSAVQAANISAQNAGIANAADALLLSAGFVDSNAPPVVPEMEAAGVLPDIPQNTSPMFPANPAVGVTRGIEA